VVGDAGDSSGEERRQGEVLLDVSDEWTRSQVIVLDRVEFRIGDERRWSSSSMGSSGDLLTKQRAGLDLGYVAKVGGKIESKGGGGLQRARDAAPFMVAFRRTRRRRETGVLGDRSGVPLEGRRSRESERGSPGVLKREGGGARAR
jgi:hypothetical protein